MLSPETRALFAQVSKIVDDWAGGFSVETALQEKAFDLTPVAILTQLYVLRDIAESLDELSNRLDKIENHALDVANNTSAIKNNTDDLFAD